MKKPITKRWWFWLIIVLVVVGLVGAFGGNNDQPSAQPTSEAISTPAPTTSSEDAKTNDGILQAAFNSGKRYYDLLAETVSNLGTSTNTLDVYNICEDIKSHIPGFSERLDEIVDPNIENYREAVNNYLWNYSIIADDLMQYLETNNIKDLDAVQEGIQVISAFEAKVIETRTAYLQLAGLSQEDIDAITNE